MISYLGSSITHSVEGYFLQILWSLYITFDCRIFGTLQCSSHKKTKLSHVQQVIVITEIYILPATELVI